MGVSFRIFNFDKKRYSDCTKPSEAFFEHIPIPLSRWVIPVWDTETLTVIRRDFPRLAHYSKSPGSNLLRLPNELLRMVFLMIGPEYLWDAVSLCLADGRLLDIGYNEVQKLKLLYADYAGDRSGQRTKVLPQAGNGCQEDYNSDDKNFTTYELRHAYKKLRSHPFNYDMDWRWPFSLSPDEVRAARKLKYPLYESPQPWVLCNITKGVYVRVDALAKLEELECGATPFLKGGVRLDQVLLSQISWNLNGSLDMLYEYEQEGGSELHRGPWAGDQFVVTTIERMKKNMEWRDTSTEVVDLLEKICLAEYGDDWRNAMKFFR
ncbi:hypothetical protein BDW22DRAFT_1432448 [Trametopsis cervina]|nr:hypothetical protein BDW22DRAFT_1432448 [Trametopsis cervina]